MSPREVAGDWQQACSEIKQRGARLLRSGLWVDCAFLVGAAQELVLAHKLLLGMASPVFERMFYGALPPGDEPVRIADIQLDAFRALLEYIYTDDIKINSVSHGCELYCAAHKYMLPHLVQVCSTYLSCNLGPADACRCYELACLFDDKILSKRALKVICSDTKDVLEADSFLEAELNTVVTVFKREALNIDSELDLLIAAEKYARSMDSKSVEPLDDLLSGDKFNSLKIEQQTSCTHEQNEIENVEDQERSSSEASDVERDCGNSSQTDPPAPLTIRDAVQHIRFLTLTPQQFAAGPARSSLLTQEEIFALLLNISSTELETPMPRNLSSSRKKRQHNEYGIKEATIRLEVNDFSERNGDVQSDPVIIQNLPWRLQMKPGRESDVNRQIGLFLSCDGVAGSKNWACVVEREFRLLSTRPVMKLSRDAESIYFSGGNSRGYINFIPWAVVVDPARGYIRDDTVTFEAHVIVKKVQGVPRTE